MRFSMITLGGLLLAAATPAMAQDEAEPAPAVTVTGSVTGVTDYRFRGLTQSAEDPAFQAGVNVNHESGFYVGLWGSTIDDTTSLPGYGNVEIDAFVGYTKTFESGFGVDGGLLYYIYPDGASGVKTDWFEPYASIMYTAGPVTAKVGANYSWGGQAGLAGNDSLYLRGDLTVAVPGTPISLLGHVGLSDGQLAVLSPDGNYVDYMLGVEVAKDFVKGGVQFVNTDITKVGGLKDAIGADATFLGYITLSF
jgi:uncharacterized protein (TIGR02001 family)